MERSRMILLDTHMWIWLMNGHEPLRKRRFLRKIENAAKNNTLFISPISIWELGMLQQKGRIHLNQNINDWVQAALGEAGIRLLPISPEIAIESCQLPGEFHGDPADRLIVAAARREKLELATLDKAIQAYAKQGFVTVLS